MKNSVKELRLGADFSQASLAAAVEVSRQTIIAIETGRYDPSLKLAMRIARHFRARVEEIFDDEA